MVITAHQGKVRGFHPEEFPGSTLLLSLPSTPGRLRDALEETEKAVIEATLEENEGEINATYRELGISRRALYERMKKYDLQKESFKKP